MVQICNEYRNGHCQIINQLLFEKLKEKGADITLKEIEEENIEKDLEVFTNCYWISNSKLFWAIVDNFFRDEVFAGEILEKVTDVEREIDAYGRGPATWEFEMNTNKFNVGYISMYALNNYLGVIVLSNS